jgi:tetratricopeptide (TPR) repeat protein
MATITPAAPAARSEFDRLVAEGLAASQADDRERALGLFTQASEADPGSGVPHFLIGSEHASAGDFAAAELAFACAVLLAPGFSLARYQLGLLQFSTQRAALALLTWQPLLSLPEDDALPHFVRGFTALAQDAPEDALRHFRSGLACGPANPALCSDVLQLVQAVEQLGQPATDHVLLSAYGRGLH